MLCTSKMISQTQWQALLDSLNIEERRGLHDAAEKALSSMNKKLPKTTEPEYLNVVKIDDTYILPKRPESLLLNSECVDTSADTGSIAKCYTESNSTHNMLEVTPAEDNCSDIWHIQYQGGLRIDSLYSIVRLSRGAFEEQIVEQAYLEKDSIPEGELKRVFNNLYNDSNKTLWRIKKQDNRFLISPLFSKLSQFTNVRYSNIANNGTESTLIRCHVYGLQGGNSKLIIEQAFITETSPDIQFSSWSTRKFKLPIQNGNDESLSLPLLRLVKVDGILCLLVIYSDQVLQHVGKNMLFAGNVWQRCDTKQSIDLERSLAVWQNESSAIDINQHKLSIRMKNEDQSESNINLILSSN